MVNCITCKTKGFYSHKYKSLSTIFKDKKIFTCLECEHSWAIDIKQSELNEYYKKDYDLEISRSNKVLPPKQYFSNIDKQFKLSRSKLHLSAVKQYLKKLKKPLILDIGSGLGTTLNLSKKYFIEPEIYAFENDENSKKYLNYIKSKIISGDFISTFKNKNIKFDAIIVSHFLEHVSPINLKVFIDTIYNILAPSGILLVEVPNDNWVKFPERKYSHPPHVNFFSSLSLKTNFKKFKIIRCCSIRELVEKKKPDIFWFIAKIYTKMSYILHKIVKRVYIPCVRSGNGTSLLLIAKK